MAHLAPRNPQQFRINHTSRHELICRLKKYHSSLTQHNLSSRFASLLGGLDKAVIVYHREGIYEGKNGMMVSAFSIWRRAAVLILCDIFESRHDKIY